MTLNSKSILYLFCNYILFLIFFADYLLRKKSISFDRNIIKISLLKFSKSMERWQKKCIDLLEIFFEIKANCSPCLNFPWNFIISPRWNWNFLTSKYDVTNSILSRKGIFFKNQTSTVQCQRWVASVGTETWRRHRAIRPRLQDLTFNNEEETFQALDKLRAPNPDLNNSISSLSF